MPSVKPVAGAPEVAASSTIITFSGIKLPKAKPIDLMLSSPVIKSGRMISWMRGASFSAPTAAARSSAAVMTSSSTDARMSLGQPSGTGVLGRSG